jgi:hypothetical protein
MKNTVIPSQKTTTENDDGPVRKDGGDNWI